MRHILFLLGVVGAVCWLGGCSADHPQVHAVGPSKEEAARASGNGSGTMSDSTDAGGTAPDADLVSTQGEPSSASDAGRSTTSVAGRSPALPAGKTALDAFWVATDGRIEGSWAGTDPSSASWHAPFSISDKNAARAGSPVAAITRLNGALDVFWIDADGSLNTAWANRDLNKGVWHAPFTITEMGAAAAASPLAVVTRLRGALDAFWIAEDGSVYTNWANPEVDGTKWHSAIAIAEAQAARADSGLAAVTRLSGALDAFWIGPDGSINTNWANPAIDNAEWHSPLPIAPAGSARAGSPVAAVTRLEGALDAFWIGENGSVYTNWANPKLDSAKWHEPFAIAGTDAARADSPLFALTRLAGALDVFWIGADGSINTTWANPDIDAAKWHDPFTIAEAGAARPGSPLVAVTRLDGALDVFWIDAEGRIMTTWANPKIDDGNWHPAFALTSEAATRADSMLAVVSP